MKEKNIELIDQLIRYFKELKKCEMHNIDKQLKTDDSSIYLLIANMSITTLNAFLVIISIFIKTLIYVNYNGIFTIFVIFMAIFCGSLIIYFCLKRNCNKNLQNNFEIIHNIKLTILYLQLIKIKFVNKKKKLYKNYKQQLINNIIHLQDNSNFQEKVQNLKNYLEILKKLLNDLK